MNVSCAESDQVFLHLNMKFLGKDRLNILANEGNQTVFFEADERRFGDEALRGR